jgi:predicted porin
MKKLLTTVIALSVAGGVTAALADVSISGNVRFHYESWSDNNIDDATSGNNNTKMSSSTDIWVKGSHTSDSGLAYSGEVRLHQNDGDRVYVSLSDDWGKFNLGQDWSPVYSKSLGADWRGTITASGAPDPSRKRVMTSSYATTTSGKSNKIAYYTPSLGGFSAGLSMADGGAESKGDSTEYVLQYALPVMNGNMTFSYGGANQNVANDEPASAKTANSEMGLAFDSGPWLVSFVQITSEKTPNKKMTSKVEGALPVYVDVDDASDVTTDGVQRLNDKEKTARVVAVAASDNPIDKQSASELEVAYDVSDNLTVNLVVFDAKVSEGKTKMTNTAQMRLVQNTPSRWVFMCLLHKPPSNIPITPTLRQRQRRREQATTRAMA